MIKASLILGFGLFSSQILAAGVTAQPTMRVVLKWNSAALQGVTDYGVTFPPANDILDDEHVLVSTTSVLNSAGLNSCTYSCNQTYSAVSDPKGNSCGSVNLGSFLITYTFNKDTMSGTPVTRTTVTDH